MNTNEIIPQGAIMQKAGIQFMGNEMNCLRIRGQKQAFTWGQDNNNYK